MKNNKKYTVASFFAGVGGIDLGLEQTGHFKTIYANEIDAYARKTFSLNFHDPFLDPRDIRKVNPQDVPDVDMIIGGFPCQAFSIAGRQEGFWDKKDRGNLFFELARIIEAKEPEIVLFENVKNLVHHDNGNTFKIICDKIKSLGYNYSYKVLNASEYGNIPQNRERVYIIGFKNNNNFTWPRPQKLTTSLQDIIDFENEQLEKYYYKKGKYKGDIYEKLVEATEDDDFLKPSIYQWRRKYVRKNKNNLIPTLTANQGEGGHNVCIIKTKYGIRKMTPRECFSAQGFPHSFILPNDLADSKLYKQAGNSVCVPVIKRIAEQIL